MAGRWRTRDGGWSVEVVTISHTPDHHDGTWLRVRNYGFFITDLRHPEELASYLDVEELLEEALGGDRRWLTSESPPAPGAAKPRRARAGSCASPAAPRSRPCSARSTSPPKLLRMTLVRRKPDGDRAPAAPIRHHGPAVVFKAAGMPFAPAPARTAGQARRHDPGR